MTDSTRIGASGVVYAIFGLMWVTSREHPSFQKVLDSRTVALFLLWLIGCLAATLAKVWEVGNAAHITGLIFGAGIGAWWRWPARRRLLKFGFGSLCLLAVVPLFWAPWSIDWTSEQGMRAYKRGDYSRAVKWYRRSLSLGQDEKWCWQNIAFAYSAAGDKPRLQETLEVLRKLDKKSADEVEQDIGAAHR